MQFPSGAVGLLWFLGTRSGRLSFALRSLSSVEFPVHTKEKPWKVRTRLDVEAAMTASSCKLHFMLNDANRAVCVCLRAV